MALRFLEFLLITIIFLSSFSYDNQKKEIRQK